jgi:hypothetical protein
VSQPIRTGDDESDTSALLIALGIVGAMAVIFVVGFGFGAGWATPQWGHLSGWPAGGFTFAAVVVALRGALQAQREAARAERSRLVDHELQRRRENLKCLSDLWAAMGRMGPPFVTFIEASIARPHRPGVVADVENAHLA